MLGYKERFLRLRQDSVCWNGRDYTVTKEPTTCPCTLEDFQWYEQLIPTGVVKASDQQKMLHIHLTILSFFTATLASIMRKTAPSAWSSPTSLVTHWNSVCTGAESNFRPAGNKPLHTLISVSSPSISFQSSAYALLYVTVVTGRFREISVKEESLRRERRLI